MVIRAARIGDIDAIRAIYDGAISYMASHGNPTQWFPGYITRELVGRDIDNGVCYVCLKDDSSEIVGVFSLIGEADPAYAHIEGRGWSSTAPYGVIHRLASSGEVGGVSRECFSFCETKYSYLRIDTHRDNALMRHNIVKAGFTECGIIEVAPALHCIAYDKVIDNKRIAYDKLVGVFGGC